MKQTIRSQQIKTASGLQEAQVPVRAVVGPFTIHRPYFVGDINRYGRACWCVTHRASGYRVTTVRTLGKAKEVATQLADIGDWGWSDPKDFSKELKAAAWIIVRPSRLG